MVTNTTIDTINLIKDIDFEYNIKLILILTFYVYAILMLYLSFRIQLDWFWWKIVKILFRVVGWSWIFFLPLFWLLLLRTVSFEVVYLYMIGYYTIAIGVITILFMLGFAEFGARLLGFDVKPSRIKMSNKTLQRLFE